MRINIIFCSLLGASLNAASVYISTDQELYRYSEDLQLTSYPVKKHNFADFYLLRWHGQVVRQKPAKLPFPSSNLGATLFSTPGLTPCST